MKCIVLMCDALREREREREKIEERRVRENHNIPSSYNKKKKN